MAERATELDDSLMTMSSQIQAGWHLADILIGAAIVPIRSRKTQDRIDANALFADAMLRCEKYASVVQIEAQRYEA
jgi:hypothetical protein